MCGCVKFRAVRLLLTAALLVPIFPSIALGQRTGIDLDGKRVNPFDVASGKIVVLIFVRRDCPVSSRYAPLIQQISARHEQDASFWLIFPDKEETPETIHEYLRQYNYRLPALRDPAHALARLAHVQITPEVAVFARSRRLIYDGRIDNWYIEPGRARPAPTTYELEEAIEAALAGNAPREAQVTGVGCYISDIE
ncbi:MAG: redoxin domain-containing protein [Candidatus Sulfotelmatobacter sp.]